MNLFNQDKCRMCGKEFNEFDKFQPSMICRSLVFDSRWFYLCNDCALQTSYFWERKEDKIK